MRHNNPLLIVDFVGINNTEKTSEVFIFRVLKNNKITARLPQVYPKFFMILSESLRQVYGKFWANPKCVFWGYKKMTKARSHPVIA